MAQNVKRLSNMRTKFEAIDKNLLRWFPGHMGKGMKQIQQKLHQIDCVVEVHDARIPLSGRNPQLVQLTSMKPHILVLNKMDLVPKNNRERFNEILRKQNVNHVIYTNCKDFTDKGVREIFRLMVKLISNSDRFNRSEINELLGLIIGVPNVGKSSLINLLRNKNLKMKSASAVGAEAGITRSVLNRIKVSENPDVYIVDTPGILTPNVGDVTVGLKLALCSCLQDHMVGDEIIADYLLYELNRRGNFSYVDPMGLDEPCDNITEVLTKRAVYVNNFRMYVDCNKNKMMIPNLLESAKFMIRSFRTGKFGKINLDDDFLESCEESYRS